MELCWFYIYIYIVNLTQIKVIWEEETSIKKNTSNRLAYRQVCRTFSWLVINVGGYRLLWAVASLVMWFLEWKAGHTTHGDQVNRQHSCMHVFCFCSCLQVPTLLKFLPCLPSMTTMIRMYTLNKPFLSQEGKVLISILSQHQKAL